MSQIDGQAPARDVAKPHSARAERYGGPGMRLDDQQRVAPEGRRVRDDHLRRGRPRSWSRPTRRIKGIADLNGKTVATTTGTTSVQTLRKNKRAANMDFKEVFGKDHADSFLLLESGRADAFVMDGQILAGLVSKSKNPADYKILRRDPVGRADRLHDAQGRSGVPEGGRQQHPGAWSRAASSPRCTTSGSCSRFRRPTPRSALPLSDATKDAWANPNTKPMEEYATAVMRSP